MSDQEKKLNYEVMEPGATFKNKTLSDLVQEWSNWFYQSNARENNNGEVVFLRSIPFSKGEYKVGPNVVVGTESLVISDSQRVLLPIITANSVSFNTESPEAMYGYVRSHIKNGNSPPLATQVRINGETIVGKDLERDFTQYEVETPIFQIAIPDVEYGQSLKDQGDNAVEFAGLFPAVTRGFFVLLQFKPEADQEDYYIESEAKGATTDLGPYTASLFYHIIVNKSSQSEITEKIRRDVTPERPNRRVQNVIDELYANNKLGAGEYLDIMTKIRIPINDQRFRTRAQSETEIKKSPK